jgi:hypothetical protein
MLEATSQRARATRRQLEARRRRGLTLIEAAMTTIIIGVAVLGVMSAFTAFHQKNQWASRVATATHLANEIREMTYHLPRHDPVTWDENWGPEGNEADFDFDDLDDLDGLFGSGTIFTTEDPALFAPHNSADVLDGPLSARRLLIENMEGWTQKVEVYNVDGYDIAFDPDNPPVGLDGLTDYMAVVVTVMYRAPTEQAPNTITRIGWVAPK